MIAAADCLYAVLGPCQAVRLAFSVTQSSCVAAQQSYGLTHVLSAGAVECLTSVAMLMCLQDVARLDSKAKVAQVRERAARAVGNCSRENAWPSKVVEAYPAGTFNRAPQQLKAIRKHYQKPPQNGPDEGQ